MISPIEIPPCLIIKDGQCHKLNILECNSPSQSLLLIMGYGCPGCKQVFTQLLQRLQRDKFYLFILFLDESDSTKALINDLEILNVPKIYKVQNESKVLEAVPLQEILAASI